MSPHETLGTFTKNLDRRFRDFDTGMASKLIEAMQYEDKILNQYIEKNRLSEWLRTTLEAAQSDVDSLAEEEVGEQHASAAFSASEEAHVSTSLFGNGSNGTVRRSSGSMFNHAMA